jgi:hypothetical protein
MGGRCAALALRPFAVFGLNVDFTEFSIPSFPAFALGESHVCVVF